MNRKLLSFLVLAAALFAGGFILASAGHAQTSTPAASGGGLSGITYPVPELGNCANQADCQSYCNDPAHMDACISFAKAHGLMTDAEASTAEKFKSSLQSGGGPGGCSTPEECQNYCSTIANLQTCLDFAKAHGMQSDPQTQTGQKILAYIQSGGKMPGGCTSQSSCETYCGDFTHAKECYDFATKAGIAQGPGAAGPGGQGGPGGPGQGMPSPDQLQKLAALAAAGQTPGGCTSKDQCETYCEDSSHRAECLAFAQQMGFVSADQAAKIQANGFTGPGGCNSDSSCQAYCNDQSHRDECYQFAKDHGLLSQQDVQSAEQGLVRLRAGLQNAPPQVTACLQSALGPNVINDIQSGKLTPGPDTGDQIKNCFDKFGASSSPQSAFQNIPPDVKQCLIQKLGQDAFSSLSSGKTQPTPEIADTARVCFQSQQFGQGQPGQPGGQNGMPPGGFQNFLQSAPPGIVSCLKDKLGSGFATLQSGGDTSGIADLQDKMQSCFESFRPQPPQQENSIQGLQGQGMPGPQGGLPPGIGDCVKQAVGEDAWTALQNGGQPSTAAQSAIQKCMQQMGNPGQGPGREGEHMPNPQFGNMPPGGATGTPPGFSPPQGMNPPNQMMQPGQQPPGGFPPPGSASGTVNMPPPPPPPPPSSTSTTGSSAAESFLGSIISAVEKLFGR